MSAKQRTRTHIRVLPCQSLRKRSFVQHSLRNLSVSASAPASLLTVASGGKTEGGAHEGRMSALLENSLHHWLRSDKPTACPRCSATI